MSVNIQSVKDFLRLASDEELCEVSAVLNDEKSAREARAEASRKRNEWVDSWFLKYLGHSNAIAEAIGTTTVVALYNRTTGVRIATARCMSSDTYDYDTGVAVAYAKLCNEPIPDYV